MTTIENIVREINKELAPQFEEKLRAHLAKQDRDWLIEQIVRLTLDKHSLEELDRRQYLEAEGEKHLQRIDRLKKMNLGVRRLKVFIARYKKISREMLIAENYLNKHAPPRGTALITGEFRSAEGEKLLQYAKDILFGLLFGDKTLNVEFERVHRELLTLNIPRAKAGAFNFLKANAELNALETWQDSTGEALSDNILLEIEYGETADEMVGNGIVAALRLINHLEVNEEILYGRMSEIEQSTLVSQKIMKIQ